MFEFTTLEELGDIVDENQGVATVTMLSLRRAYGYDRLGVHVRAGLSRKLQQLGLGHLPTDLPESQHACARVYRMGSAVQELIDAVNNVSIEDPRPDELLRERAGGEAAELLQKVREMVCG